MANDFGQEQVQPMEEPTIIGIKPFEFEVKRNDRGDLHEIYSGRVMTPMGKLVIYLNRYDSSIDLAAKAESALGINEKGKLVKKTDHEFHKKGYYSLSCFIDSPPIGPLAALNFRLWSDSDIENVLLDQNVTIDEVYDTTEDDNLESEPYHYSAGSWGPERKTLWVNPNEDVLRQINVSVESLDTGGDTQE